ncbi:hypothetical protein F4825DRAFT_430803, partial [Nemania diffusa]
MQSQPRFHNKPIATKSIMPKWQWSRIKRLLLLTRLVSAVSFLALCIARRVEFATLTEFLLGPIVSILIIASDLTAILPIPREYSPLPSGIALLFDLVIIVVILYLLVGFVMIFTEYGHSYYLGYTLDGIWTRLVAVPILIVSVVMVIHDGRALPNSWRIRRERRNIRPLLAFTRTGEPLAVLPTPQLGEESVLRLSIDSLQQFTEEAGV